MRHETLSKRDLVRITDGAEARANHDYVVARRHIDPHYAGDIIDVLGGSAIYSGPDEPLNYAVGLGLGTPITSEGLDQLESFYHSRQMAVSVEVATLADPKLLEALGERRYTVSSFGHHFVEQLDPHDYRPPGEITTVLAESLADRRLWASLVAQGFSEETDIAEREIRFALAFLEMPGTYGFIAALHGTPAAAGAVAFDRDHHAHLFSTSTLKKFRRQGLQRALLETRLAFASANGARFATIATDPGSPSERNVERAGFQLGFARATLKKAPPQ